ncbi:MAG: hypothetical protein JKX70_11185 [Phycisphaerales bacterium]|nr:hypothetical protein [Phycisphaerales bacterium]
MILTTMIGAMTLAALGPTSANDFYVSDRITTPEMVEIRAEMIDTNGVDRGQIRFSDQTRGQVVAVSNADGSIGWASSDREKLGGQGAPALIYVRMFDGIFAIDPFQPLPAANDSTAAMLFRGTTLETNRAQYGRQQIDRTKELFEKLEQARQNWLQDNGFYGVRVFTNPNAQATGEEQAKAKGLPKPSAVFERPADIPRIKSREQVKAKDQSQMSGVVAMLAGDEPVRISLPHNMAADVVARVEKKNESQAKTATVALDK